jgi:hypothetical protein
MSSRIECLTEQCFSRESASAGDGPATPALSSVTDAPPPDPATSKLRVQAGRRGWGVGTGAFYRLPARPVAAHGRQDRLVSSPGGTSSSPDGYGLMALVLELVISRNFDSRRRVASRVAAGRAATARSLR